MSYLPAEIRDRLLEADNHHCAYCKTTQANTGQPMTVDHIVPHAQGGETQFENLCFACRRCNEFKGSAITAQDPLTGQMTPLFHPRQQIWDDHFQRDESGALLVGLSVIGRATLVALNMNNPVITDVRRRWVGVGWYSPKQLYNKANDFVMLREQLVHTDQDLTRWLVWCWCGGGGIKSGSAKLTCTKI